GFHIRACGRAGVRVQRAGAGPGASSDWTVEVASTDALRGVAELTSLRPPTHPVAYTPAARSRTRRPPALRPTLPPSSVPSSAPHRTHLRPRPLLLFFFPLPSICRLPSSHAHPASYRLLPFPPSVPPFRPSIPQSAPHAPLPPRSHNPTPPFPSIPSARRSPPSSARTRSAPPSLPYSSPSISIPSVPSLHPTFPLPASHAPRPERRVPPPPPVPLLPIPIRSSSVFA
ncbi:hypothetical protein B0H17DRAFT_1113850, partial [Mycena rosella]